MGWHFHDMSGVDPFVIDQNVTVDFGRGAAAVGAGAAGVPELTPWPPTAAPPGILRDQAPPPLAGWVGIDALVVSTDNEMTA